MAYDFYLDKMLLPVAPPKLEVKVGGNNKTVHLINDGEVNLLKERGLVEISFEALLPNVKYPFAKYSGGMKMAEYYLRQMYDLKEKNKPFQFIVSRSMLRGKNLFSTNIKVCMEDLQIIEDAKNGFDITVSIKLKEYRDYGTKTIPLDEQGNAENVQQKRETAQAPVTEGQSYTVVKGDSLWKIAKSSYGKGSDYSRIYEANKSQIKNPNLIYPGQVFVLP